MPGWCKVRVGHESEWGLAPQALHSLAGIRFSSYSIFFFEAIFSKNIKNIGEYRPYLELYSCHIREYRPYFGQEYGKNTEKEYRWYLARKT